MSCTDYRNWANIMRRTVPDVTEDHNDQGKKPGQTEEVYKVHLLLT